MALLEKLRSPLRGFASDSRGAVIIELALVIPVALVIIVGSYDTARYVLLHQKIDRASSTMADLVAQPDTFDPDTDLAPLYPAASRLLDPFDMATSGHIIISEVTGEAGDIPRITWQRDGGGSYAASSEIGSEGDVANLPDAFTIVREGETMIVAEVFYDYAPLFIDYVLSPQEISHQSYRRPRQR